MTIGEQSLERSHCISAGASKGQDVPWMQMNWYMDSAVLLAQDRQFHQFTIQRSYEHADSTSGLVYYIILKTLLMLRC